MTNREHLNLLSDEDFADWICKQMFPEYEANNRNFVDAARFHTVRNFLKMEYTEEKTDDRN